MHHAAEYGDDWKANPCMDFAPYSCANFSELYPARPDEILDGLHCPRLYGSRAAGATTGSPRSAQHSANEQKIGDFYASCLDEDVIHTAKLKPLQPSHRRPHKKQLTALLEHDRMININAFFGHGEVRDFKDAQKHIAVVDQGGLGLPVKGGVKGNQWGGAKGNQ